MIIKNFPSPKNLRFSLFEKSIFLFAMGAATFSLAAQKKIIITDDMIWADHAQVKMQAPVLFDGKMLENTGFWFDERAVPDEVVIPNTELRGQILIVDLKGKVDVQKVRVFDTYGVDDKLDIYCSDEFFKPKKVATEPLDGYNGWREVDVNQIARYLYFGAPKGGLSGFGELEIIGQYLEKDPEPQSVEPFTGKTLAETWGINTHDYSHAPDQPEVGLYNTQSVNPMRNERTYAEYHKNYNNQVIKGEPLFADKNWAGSVRPNHAKRIANKNGTLMFSMVGNLPKFMDTYPKEFQHRGDLPWIYWDENLSFEDNRKRMYDPQTWAPLRDEMVKIAEALKEYDQTVILQAFNEYDKLWRGLEHRLNPFMVAAAQSMMWDGHEGKFGKGIKDVSPKMKLAWISTAYNNLAYVKMANEWFKANRIDGEFCADLIATNSYCNNQGGLQHRTGSHGIPPEDSEWLRKTKQFYEYSQRMGKEFALTEFGYDHSGVSKNSVVLKDEAFQDDREKFGESRQQTTFYDDTFWPKWKDELLQQQAAWDVRAYLTATPYTHFLFKYHIRDEGEMGSRICGVYSSCGIAENHGYAFRKGLSLKPNGLALKKIIDEVGDFVPYKQTENNGLHRLYLKKDGTEKIIEWREDWDSMPKIVDAA